MPLKMGPALAELLEKRDRALQSHVAHPESYNAMASWETADDDFRERVALIENAADDFHAKLKYLFEHFVTSESGTFAFPDGDMWECKKGPIA